ncbi:membrane protein [Microbacterium sp. CH12i]|uniref:vitamin K epoxide reductase family protein n=1 Tax=Microbacterium sp. CH12i TaxID=1479651 RepID=UPI0004615E14|nr:vitamin K epoxide reductase family protein [Microbacterium sp. CH12i]KDA06261.1 membrane protein [Microbacterium sp. CH12i]
MSEQRTRPVGYAVWLIIASVIGWWAAFELTVEKFALLENPQQALSCDLSLFIQCSTNLQSWQGSVFGFPNPIIGLAGWMAALVVGVALLAGARFPRWFWATFAVGITFAFGLVCWLIGQSLFELFVLCPWCMVTWAVTIPTFFATVVQLFRNGTLSRSQKVRQRAGRLMVWVPLATILAYALIIVMAQLQGLNFLGEMARLLFSA